MDVDVAIVGASFAGLSAAMMLARGRRRVVLIDDGQMRNRSAAASHGFLGLDGAAPMTIRDRGLTEVLAYPTAALVHGRVTRIDGVPGAFVLEGAAPVRAARVILAYGQRDILPEIPGLAECWGKTAIQCPYCHGYELADRTTGLLASGTLPLHHARHLQDWVDDLVLLENGVRVGAADSASLDRPGVRRVAGRVARIIHRDGRIEAVELADGDRVAMQSLYLLSRHVPAASLAADLGCATTETESGSYVTVDAFQRTSVPGVFGAGDMAHAFASGIQAAASGSLAGASCHEDLLDLLPEPEEG